MSEQPLRVFSTEFKQSLMLRLEAGETLAGLAKETGIRRKLLYEWREAWRKLGVAGLNRKRGPKPGGGRRVGKSALLSEGSAPDTANQSDTLKLAQTRIAELERVIGRQQVDLDFFRQALQLRDAAEALAPTVPASTRSSKR
jgi:transposase